MIIRFNGEDFDGDMTLSDFVKSINLRDYQFFAHPKEFIIVSKDERLKDVCEELKVDHI